MTRVMLTGSQGDGDDVGNERSLISPALSGTAASEAANKHKEEVQ